MWIFMTAKRRPTCTYIGRIYMKNLTVEQSSLESGNRYIDTYASKTKDKAQKQKEERKTIT